MALDVQSKRIYDPADAGDGYRVLIDHVWPARRLTRARTAGGVGASWLPATGCASGLTTFPSGLTSFAPATGASSPIMAR
jgi:uncharacterized protein YeaO (DUF488 family)